MARNGFKRAGRAAAATGRWAEKHITPPAGRAIAFTAEKTAQGISQAAFTDIAVIRGSTRYRKNRAPLDYELHINPAGIALGAVGGAVALWLLQIRPDLSESTEDWGHWIWSDGTSASKDGWYSERGNPPQRIVAYTDYAIHTGRGYGGETHTDYYTEYATWKLVEQDKKRVQVGLTKRRGFMEGSDGQSEPWRILLPNAFW